MLILKLGISQNNKQMRDTMNTKIRPSDELSKKLQSILFGEGSNMIEELIKTSAEKIIQEALEEELTDYLGRNWYERSSTEEGFKGYRNGYVNKRYKSSEGILNIRRPRLRDNEEDFESEVIRRLSSIENTLKTIALESYVRGLSTRDIEETFKDEKGNSLISRSGVSNMTDKLYKEYEEFSKRDLSSLDVVYLYADGVYEAVRKYSNNQAILCCWAICSDGSKQMLHMSAASGESYSSWSMFFQEMLDRGLRQPVLVISDGSNALISAISSKFPKADRQRCIAHKIRNLMSKLPKDKQAEIKTELHQVYYASNQESGEILASEFINKYIGQFPEMIRSFSSDLNACLTQLNYPEGHRKHIRTTNLIERCFVEEKRRTKIIPQHVHEKSAIGLVYSVLIRASNKWNRVKMSSLELTELRNIRNLIYPEAKDDEFISYKFAS